jgi:hypothetical protein
MFTTKRYIFANLLVLGAEVKHPNAPVLGVL